MKVKGKSPRPRSMHVQVGKTPSGPPKSPRAKTPGNKKMNGDVGKDELYPTAVFERESSDSARKVIRGGKSRNKLMNPAMDMYNTVWLSDYESCKSDADSLCRSGLSSLNQSQSTMPTCFSEATTPFGTPGSSRPITPSHFVGIQDPNLSAFSPDDDRISVSSWNKRKLPRTLSLPESEFATLDATDLQERFTRLQLEQENKELKKLTEDLQEALEKLEEQFIEHVQKPESERTYNNLSDASPRSPLIEKNFEPFSQSERQLLKKLRHDSDLSYDNDDYEKDKRRNCCVTQ